MSSPRIVLASTSPYRRALMEKLGVPFHCAAPTCDEDALKDPRLSPRELAVKLARAKSESLRAEFPDAIIIGSDQVIALGETRFSKPGTRERAAAQLKQLAGKTHEVLTAVAIVHAGGVEEFLAVARMTMKALSDAAILEYVDADQPLNCAGSYKLEERGAELFSSIECEDRTAIVGLPMQFVTRALACGPFGFSELSAD